jgi:hypothetical protein
MRKIHTVSCFGSLLAILCLLSAGCGGKSDSRKSGSTEGGKTKTGTTLTGGNAGGKTNKPEIPVRKPIFGGKTETGPGTAKVQTGNRTGSNFNSVKDALKPLQIIIGSWNGVTKKVIGNFQAIEKPAWQWDFTKNDQPAFSFSSGKSPYLRKGRLTYLVDSKKYELTATDKDGVERVYQGIFSEPIEDVPGEGKGLERTFKLTLLQVKPAPGKKEPIVKIDLQQRNNNRYWMIVYRKTGTTTREWDRVGNQRDGTAIAASLDDYGDRTCVVTQGLGTTAVSYKGKTYYVCCSGCKKTFEDDPAKWVASFEEWKLKNGKK